MKNKISLLVFSMAVTMMVVMHANCQVRSFVETKLTHLANRNRLNPVVDNSIVGTPYLQNEFANGNVFSNKGKYTGVMMRYDIYNDLIEFQQVGGVYALEPKLPIEKIEFTGRTLLVEKFKQKGKEITGFFELLDTGKVVLLAKMMVSFTEKKEPSPMQYEGTPAKYTRLKDVFYVKGAEGKLVKVTSVDEMIESFPDKQAEMKAFVKKERLSNAKDRSDLIAIIRHYNSL